MHDTAPHQPLAWTDEWLRSLGLSRDGLAAALGGSYNGEIDVDLVNSRTLRALAGAGEASRSLLAKAQGELRALGSYAASKAAADSRLLLSVGVVAAAEVAAYLARPLLLGAASSSASAAASSSQGQGEGGGGRGGGGLSPPTLTLKEKVELVQAGMLGPWELANLALGDGSRAGAGAGTGIIGLLGGGGRGRFAVRSFADAGDPDALLMDMYVRAREARGGLPLPPLPKQLAALALPLRALASLPALPGAALRALDAAHRLDVGAQARRPTRRLLRGMAEPLLPTLEAWAAGAERKRRDDRLLAAGIKAGGRWWGGLGVEPPPPPRRAFSREEEAAIMLQLGVLGSRGGAAAAGGSVAAGVPLWEEEEEEDEDGGRAWGGVKEGDGVVPTMAVSRVSKSVCTWAGRTDLYHGHPTSDHNHHLATCIFFFQMKRWASGGRGRGRGGGEPSAGPRARRWRRRRRPSGDCYGRTRRRWRRGCCGPCAA